jgi:hypothetical protein
LHAVFTLASEIKMFLTRTLVAAVLLAASLPAAAKDLTIQGLSQDDFHKISQDLGAALSYKPLSPAEILRNLVEVVL